MKVCFVVNKLSFFLSHRLDLACFINKYYNFILITDLSDMSDYDRNILKNKNISAFHVDRRNRQKGWLDWFRYFFNLRKTIKSIAPDHIFFITLELSMIGIALHNFINSKKSFFVITGVSHHLVSNEWKIITKRLIFFFFNPLLYLRKKHLFIFQNEDDQKLFMKKNMALSRSSQLIRGSGVNGSLFFSKDSKTHDDLIFLFSSRLVISKGIMEFYDAAMILKKNYPEVVFRVSGIFDPDDPECISQEQLNSIISNLDYFGEVEHYDMPEILSQASVFVLPSYGEGLPKVVLEAGLTELPLILTDVPGCRDCINQQKNGLLVRPKDAEDLSEKMEQLILNKELLLQKGKQSRDFILKNFSNEIIHEQYINLFE